MKQWLQWQKNLTKKIVKKNDYKKNLPTNMVKKYIKILELSFGDFVLLKIKNVTENLLNNFSKAQKPKILQKQNLNSNKTKLLNKLYFWQNSISEKLKKKFFVRKTWDIDNLWNVLRSALTIWDLGF